MLLNTAEPYGHAKIEVCSYTDFPEPSYLWNKELMQFGSSLKK